MAKTRLIGLDIGTSTVRAAELETTGKNTPPAMVRYGELALPPGAVQDAEVVEPETVATALRQLWRTAGFKSRDVVMGVGTTHAVVRELDVPHMPMAQLRSTLPFQVQDMLPMPVEDALLDFYPTAEFDATTGRMVRGILVAVARASVQSNVMAAETAGLRPRVVDLNAFALLRSVRAPERTGEVIAAVDVGARVTTVVVSAHGAPRLVRVVPSGGQDVTDAVAGHMRISAAEAEGLKRELGLGFQVAPEAQAGAAAIEEVTRGLVESIRNTFVYYNGNNPGGGIDVVVLTGGGSHLPGFGQYLSTASRLPVTLGDPLEAVRVPKKIADTLPMSSSLSVALGLAQGVAA
ncbi:MAG: type IV pilus assembly protein PilM [Actinomycetales bacterium]|nr:type IV pilus assembly protein PilM [Actinomycetales bacterium]